MAVRQVKQNAWTKDGRKWIYEVRYKDHFGKSHYKGSKKFLTKKEAQNAEREFLNSLNVDAISNEMTFKELCLKHKEFRRGEVKDTTLYNYSKNLKYFTILEDIKVKDLDSRHYNEWKNEMNSRNLATRTKNDLYKYLKSVLNFAIKEYNFNFNELYRNMTNFKNPKERKKEMLFFTKDEFDKFIAVETDPKFKAAFETLYYCGFRSGELRGLTWDNIDFKNKKITVNKNITVNEFGRKYVVTTPKTNSSYRTIPVADVVIDDLKVLYKLQKEYYGFDDSWYVFGSIEPLGKSTLKERKNRNCKIAGVKQIRIHDFRHSCASLLINHGANITMVAKILGHTKIDETLNTYSHMYENELDNVIDMVNQLNKK